MHIRTAYFLECAVWQAMAIVWRTDEVRQKINLYCMYSMYLWYNVFHPFFQELQDIFQCPFRENTRIKTKDQEFDDN